MDKLISFIDAYEQDHRLYFSNTEYNGLFEFNLLDHTLKKLLCFNHYGKYDRVVHRNVLCEDQMLYFIPHTGDGIDTYNLKTNELGFIHFPKLETYTIATSFLYNGCVWFLPECLSQGLISFHIQDQVFQKYPEFNNQLEDEIDNDNAKVFEMNNFYVDENIVTFTVLGGHHIYQFNLTNLKLDIVPLSDNIEIHTLTNWDNQFILTELQGNHIYIVNKQDLTIKSYDLNYERSKYFPNMNVIPYKNKLFVLPGWQDKIKVLNLNISEDNKITQKYEITNISLPRGFQICRNNVLFINFYKQGNKVWLYPRAGDGFVILNLDSYETTFVPLSDEISLCEWETKRIIPEIKDESATREQNYYLHEFISMCENTAGYDHETCKNGENIWASISGHKVENI